MKKLLVIALAFVGVMFIVLFATIIIFPKKQITLINTYAKKYGLNSSLVASVINIESGFDSDAVSDAGAMGLMQILPSTAKDCAKRMGIDDHSIDLFDPNTNINIGCFYLSYLLEMFDGNLENALSSYNWGLGNVKDWIARGNVDDNGTIKDIPISETRNYIKKFKVSEFVYKNIYKMDPKS